MIKVIPPGSFDFGEPVAQQIKLPSPGLRGNDLNSLIKRAGHEFADYVKHARFEPGEVPIHLIAMGAHEAFGNNRNFDTWFGSDLKKDHHTFVKHARSYRNHSNKDPHKSYGIVKKSTYNDKMKRVELLVALNGTKEAAERNGGLVADKELQKLASDIDGYGVSMATRIPKDVCSGCGHKARNRSEYCTGTDEGGHCKYGGLRNRIGTVYDDGHILCAINPDNTFFDISMVYRPADRTAFVLGKAASANGTHNIGGAELAEMLNVAAPLSIYENDQAVSSVLPQIKLAHTLASRESGCLPNHQDRGVSRTSLQDFAVAASNDLAATLAALHQEKVALSVMDWLRLATGASEEKCAAAETAVKRCLPTVFTDLIDDPDFTDLLHSNCFKSARSTTETLKKWAQKQAADMSLDQRHAQRRIWVSTVNQEDSPKHMTKCAEEVSPVASQLAKQYAVYQLNFLQDLDKQPDKDLTLDLIIRQNRVS